MKKLFKYCVLLLQIVCLSLTAKATDYYFKSSGTSTTCTSDADGCPITQVSSHGAAGDRLLFKKGDTFTGTISYTRSGSSGSPITFDLYGSATNNSVIDASGSSSETLKITGSHIVVNNLVLQNSTSTNAVVYITGGQDVQINNCYINNGTRGVFAKNCGDGTTAQIKVLNCYLASYSDPNYATDGHGGGSAVQFYAVNGAGSEIAYNNCYTDMSLSSTVRQGVGDILNVYQSNGTSSSHILVHDNNVRGGSSYPNGEAGLVLGDVGGSYQDGYNNTFISPGAVGCQVQGGHDINMSNNYLYSPSYSYTFNGLAFGNYSGNPCYNITMGGNVINWRNGNSGGGAIQNYFQDNSGSSTSTGVAGGAALAVPTNWNTNTAYSTAGAVDNSSLPDPLWTGSPWNTVNPPIISYTPSTNTFIVGTAITTWSATNTGGAATSWSITPTLSAGLSFNTATGDITGTPTAASASTSYTITATNTGGSANATITVQVNNSVPYIVIKRKIITI